jgi:hypothetical protein
MRLTLVLAATILLVGAAFPPASAEETARPAVSQCRAHQVEAISAAQRKKRARAYQAYGRSQQQIACTQFGCNPIPRGCQVVPGRNPFTWNPSGFDEVVCPYR